MGKRKRMSKDCVQANSYDGHVSQVQGYGKIPLQPGGKIKMGLVDMEWKNIMTKNGTLMDSDDRHLWYVQFLIIHIYTTM